VSDQVDPYSVGSLNSKGGGTCNGIILVLPDRWSSIYCLDAEENIKRKQ
jgi:hypothetical protein